MGLRPAQRAPRSDCINTSQGAPFLTLASSIFRMVLCIHYLGQHQQCMVWISPDNNFRHLDMKVKFTSSGIPVSYTHLTLPTIYSV